ncbi:MAG TPA: hypothetical protein VF278_25570 [Pirellulales bacterium]
MRCAIATLLLCLSLIASSLVCLDCPETRLAGGSARALPSSSEPHEDGQGSLLGSCPAGRTFMLRGREGRSFATSHARSSFDRVGQEARVKFRPQSIPHLPDLLWAHTCGVSLAQRHVLLQI